MVQNDEYIEFDLKALFFRILRQWKAIVIFGLILAVALGSLQAFLEYRTGLSVDMDNSYWTEYIQYQEQIAFYEDRVRTTQDKIDSLHDYLENSVLMNADYLNIYKADTVFHVDSGYQILPENTYQNTDKTGALSWYYRQHLEDFTVLEEIALQVGMDAKYLSELLSIYSPNDYTITVSVTHPSQEDALAILDIIIDELIQYHQELSDTVAEHTLTQMMTSSGVTIDTKLKETQQELLDELLSLQDDMILYKEELYTLKEGPAPSELNILTAFIKWFLLGGVAGGLAVALVFFLKSILRNRLHSAGQLACGYGAAVLGEAICSTPALPPVLRKINALEGCLTENSQGNFRFLAENIRNRSGAASNILICCDADPAVAASLAQELNENLTGIRLQPAADLLKDADALRALSECDGVILAAVRDVSRNAVIRKTVAQIRSYNKELIGFILTY